MAPHLSGVRTRGAPFEWRRDVLLASPVFGSIRAQLEELPAARFPVLEDLNAVAASLDAPVRFVAQAQPTAAAEYERRIAATGEVATRTGNWHDLLNALVWCAWPQTKAALNRAHVRSLETSGQAKRGRTRDRVTLFDEGGVVVRCADPRLTQSLTEHRWRALFVEARERVIARMHFFVIGHALLEKALEPYKAMTGNVLVLTSDGDALDAAVAARFAADAQLPRLTPLPILGVPGWWPANEARGFYDDAAVFRVWG